MKLINKTLTDSKTVPPNGFEWDARCEAVAILEQAYHQGELTTGEVQAFAAGYIEGRRKSKEQLQECVMTIDNLEAAHDLATEERDDIQLNLKDQMIKTKAVIEFCHDHLDQMWASKITGFLLGCDFRDAKEHVKEFFEFCEHEGIE